MGIAFGEDANNDDFWETDIYEELLDDIRERLYKEDAFHLTVSTIMRHVEEALEHWKNLYGKR